MLDKLLLVCLVFLAVMCGVDAAFDTARVFNCSIAFSGYVAEASVFLLLFVVIAGVMSLRLLSLLLLWPCGYIRRKEAHRLAHIENRVLDCIFYALCDEVRSIDKISNDLELAPKTAMANLARAITYEKSGMKAEAIREYSGIVFADGEGEKAKKLFAAKCILGLYDAWTGANKELVDAVLSKAESVSSAAWVMQARSEFYLQNREWYHALNMVEYSIFRRGKKRVAASGGDRVRSLIYCAIAGDYESIGDIGNAEKYWSRAVRATSCLDISVMGYDFLIRMASPVDVTMECLNGIFAKHHDAWAVVKRYMNLIPMLDGAGKREVIRFITGLEVVHPNKEIVLLYIKYCDGIATNEELCRIFSDIDAGGAVAGPVLAIMKAACSVGSPGNASEVFFNAVMVLDTLLMCSRCMALSNTFSVECESCGAVGSKKLLY